MKAIGKSYTTAPSPATVDINFVNGTFTARGLEGRLVLPGEGLVGASTGKLVIDMATGEIVFSSGQRSLSDVSPESPEVCAALAP